MRRVEMISFAKNSKWAERGGAETAGHVLPVTFLSADEGGPITVVLTTITEMSTYFMMGNCIEYK